MLHTPSTYLDLCPHIYDTQQNRIYYGGDQAWFIQNSKRSGGCGPIAAANILRLLAQSHPQILTRLGLSITSNNMITKVDYIQLAQKLYEQMFIKEVPGLNYLHNHYVHYNKHFKYIPSNFGIGISGFTSGVLRFTNQQQIPLNFRSCTPTHFTYTRGLTFIRLALANGYPLALLNTNKPIAFSLYKDSRKLEEKTYRLRKHFVTITGLTTIQEEPALIISTWGQTGTILYKHLYAAWQSPLSFGSAMVYFIPAKTRLQSRRTRLRAYSILIKR